MKDGLDLLYSLQTKDDAIRSTEERITDIPRQVRSLEGERDNKSENVARAKDLLKGNLEERKKFEREIQHIKEKIDKYKEQMKKVTTNMEYQGFINEIKFEEKAISAVEEKIIEKMVEGDAINVSIRNAERDFNEIAAQYNVQIKNLLANLEYEKKKLIDERKERQELAQRIPAALCKVYDQLFKKKNGKAVSYVHTDFCTACNIKLRPQVLNELIISKDIMVCENCGRILFTRIEEKETENPENAQ